MKIVGQQCNCLAFDLRNQLLLPIFVIALLLLMRHNRVVHLQISKQVTWKGSWENRSVITLSFQGTGMGTKFGAYLSPSTMLFKHKMNIYWPIMQIKVINIEYSVYST